jgi:SAM-dependent methyltransferase
MAILEAMRCPACGAGVRESTEGLGVRCSAGHRVRVRDGYLDAAADVATDDATSRTFASFGYEWTAFGAEREEDALYAEHYLRDLDLGRIEGALGLDAGCGRGRYSRFIAPRLGALVALDGSEAARSAARNLGDTPNTVVIRSDLRQAPFAAESFGFVASYGVLHHLEDPRSGFDRLVQLLDPGGVLSLYLYSRPEGWGFRRLGLAAATSFRRATVHVPHRLLRVLCVPVAALLWVTVVAAGRFGERRGNERLTALPMRTYRDKPFRSLVLDTFDRLSAPVEHRFVWSDLAPWFQDSGLEVDAARDDSGWFIVAHRPDG